ncbi:hypothetical protein ARMGADRAFT_1065632 [Armillaria gallica]|uniref:Uncharacterized protein n=1 Tax=Armillaria gallica TaxID=47427 RepID=A0A2H3DGH3_ARMGA|nr:hypothetical protein ARMGADRAFT_1065632 [Armillaria gallica]
MYQLTVLQEYGSPLIILVHLQDEKMVTRIVDALDIGPTRRIIILRARCMAGATWLFSEAVDGVTRLELQPFEGNPRNQNLESLAYLEPMITPICYRNKGIVVLRRVDSNGDTETSFTISYQREMKKLPITTLIRTSTGIYLPLCGSLHQEKMSVKVILMSILHIAVSCTNHPNETKAIDDVVPLSILLQEHGSLSHEQSGSTSREPDGQFLVLEAQIWTRDVDSADVKQRLGGIACWIIWRKKSRSDRILRQVPVVRSPMFDPEFTELVFHPPPTSEVSLVNGSSMKTLPRWGGAAASVIMPSWGSIPWDLSYACRLIFARIVDFYLTYLRLALKLLIRSEI